MKKYGHLNRDISRVLASMGHTDSIVIADCGLPVPAGVECIDLTLQIGEPGFLHVLDTVLADFQLERAVFASEAQTHNQAVLARATALERRSTAVEFVPHEEFKALTHKAKAIIRTGEATPYANVVLYSGVIF
ncbi:D-ribose pyranase [Andreprevotia chitinilytica]|uniref:D-ribose pyranase n=1 Tax=Andreprevotia chitinilytica TaxID=396808 RepID=UPI00055237EB|nr:D-ribose pyranase [Andreprevotia chitinilytica]